MTFAMTRLVGTQEEMGAQHGRLAAADAARLFAFYRELPEKQLAGDLRGLEGAVGRAAIRTISKLWQERLVRSRPPELAARSRAFAQSVIDAVPGTGTVGAALRALAAMDTLQNCVALAARGRLGPFANPFAARAAAAAVPACSTAIAWGDATADGELWFARNFDFPGIGVWDAAPAFVVNAPASGQRYAFFASRGADTAVVTVVNEAGLVMAPHTRWHRGVTLGGAMIVDLVHEIARRAESLADAVAIARELPTSSTWGLAIGSARERSALSLELAGPRLEVVRPAPGASYFVCANSYRSESMQDGEIKASPAWAIHSPRREKRLRQLVEGRKLAPEDLARCMSDRRDPESPDLHRHLGAILAQACNVHCAVVAPSLRRALVGVDRAPSCEGTWAELAWEWDGPAGSWELGDSAGSGMSASERTDIAPPHDAATKHIYTAARAYEVDHDIAAARAAIEAAVAEAPRDPSLRLAAAWLALAAADDRRPPLGRGARLTEAEGRRTAAAHVAVGLAHEPDPLRREQLYAAAAWPRDRRPHVNLMMCDAY